MTLARGAFLLEKLSGGVVPVDPAPSAGPADPFAPYLRAAGRPDLSLAPSVLLGEISDEDWRTAAYAADDAARAGMSSAVIEVGALTLRVDVDARTVRAQYAHDEPAVITDIDGFVRGRSRPVAAENDGQAGGDDADRGAMRPSVDGTGTMATGPARIVRNASLARALGAQ